MDFHQIITIPFLFVFLFSSVLNKSFEIFPIQTYMTRICKTELTLTVCTSLYSVISITPLFPPPMPFVQSLHKCVKIHQLSLFRHNRRCGAVG